jgi:Flp pilus assembly protein CpaB
VTPASVWIVLALVVVVAAVAGWVAWKSEAAPLSSDPSQTAAEEHEPDADRERSPLLRQGEAAEFQTR